MLSSAGKHGNFSFSILGIKKINKYLNETFNVTAFKQFHYPVQQ